MTTDLNKLINLGWFEGYPATLKERVETQLLDYRDLCQALEVAWFDCEYNDEGYHDIILELSRQSDGVFTPSDVLESWRHDEVLNNDIIDISYSYNGRIYSTFFEYSKYLDNHPIFELVNQSMIDSGTKLRFIRMEPGNDDDSLYFALTSLEAYANAHASGLITTNEDPYDQETWKFADVLQFSWHLNKKKAFEDRDASPSLSAIVPTSQSFDQRGGIGSIRIDCDR